MDLKLTPLVAGLAVLALAACSETGGGAPAAPTDVAATAGPGYVTVSWSDRADDETGFAVHRDPGATAELSGQQATRIGTTGPDETSFIDHDAELSTTYRYSVAALGADGAASATTAAHTDVVLEPGLDMAVGTVGRDDGSAGTAFLLYLYLPLGDLEPGDVTIEIAGPPGWNDDAPTSFTPSAAAFDDGWVTFSRFAADAAVGSFQVEATAGAATYVGEATLGDASFRFPRATGIAVTRAEPTVVEASWDAVPEAASYTVALWTESYGSLVEGYIGTTDTSFVFDGLDLTDGAYLVEVNAWPFDQSPGAPPPVPPAPYGFSYDDVTFEVPAAGTPSSNAEGAGDRPTAGVVSESTTSRGP